MTTLRLTACLSRPLGDYLKALGVFRLIAEQVDVTAEGRWDGQVFVLETELSRDDVVSFLVDEYIPTPIVSPWNGGSGFGAKDKKQVELLDRLLAADDVRLVPYQQTIRSARALVAEGLAKEELISACRATFPDEAVAWLDAAVTLTADGPRYPPLLGTGGNSGRLEYSNNHVGHLATVFGLAGGRRPPGRPESEAWAQAALFGGDVPGVATAIGQFRPVAAGGANMGRRTAGASVVNPWEFVLLFEGALLFASAPARRLAADRGGMAAMPFTFRPANAGHATSAEEAIKAELWAPLWDRLLGPHELSHLLAEGRLAWNGAQAGSGFDALRAASTLGADRGIVAFERHLLSERLGQSVIAVPAGRIEVQTSADERIDLTADLDPWIRSIARFAGGPAAPASVVRAYNAVERQLWTLADEPSSAALVGLLEACAMAERAVALMRPDRRAESGVRPLPVLEADRWLPALDDGSVELRLAAAAATAWSPSLAGSIRHALLPTDDKGSMTFATDATPRVPGLGRREVPDLLTDVLVRRSIAARRADRDGSDRQTSLWPGIAPRRGDVERLASGAIDRTRFGRLFEALLPLGARSKVVHEWRPSQERSTAPRSPVWRLLAPFFASELPMRHTRRIELSARRSWPVQLRAGHVADVVRQAQVDLRQAQLRPIPTDARRLAASVVEPDVLAAALLIPPRWVDLNDGLRSAVMPEPTTEGAGVDA